MKPAGIIPAMVTAFDEREDVNLEAMRVMTRRLIEARVHGLFVLGTNGEFFSLTFDEKVRIAEAVIEETAGRVPVYVGAGCSTTRETAALAKRLEAAGADALSVITPYFLTYSQQELIRHYRQVADATSLPIVLYNIPSRTSNALQPQTVAALAEVPNIVGIKDSSGSFDTMLQYLDGVPEDFAVLAGADSLILSCLMAGGSGAIASTANVFPELLVAIYEHWQRGEHEQAGQAQRRLQALRNAFSLGTLPSVLKYTLNAAGIPAGPPRAPVLPLTAEAAAQTDAMLARYREEGLPVTGIRSSSSSL